MKLLAFDTSSAACSVAILDSDAPQAERVRALHQQQLQRQGQLILPMIETMLADAGLKLHELDAIALGIGPGSYTGTRMATSVAQALAIVIKCPLLPVSSLAIIAQTAYMSHGWRSLMVAVDARANEIYWAPYVINDLGLAIPMHKDKVSGIEQLELPLSPLTWCGVGDGWKTYADTITQRLDGRIMNIDADLLPHAEALLALAEDLYRQKSWIAPIDAVPVYLR